MSDTPTNQLKLAIASLTSARVHVAQAATSRRTNLGPGLTYALAVHAVGSAETALGDAAVSLGSAKASQVKADDVMKEAKRRREPGVGGDVVNAIKAAQGEAKATVQRATAVRHEAQQRLDRLSEVAKLLKTAADTSPDTSAAVARLELLAEEIRDVITRVQDEAAGDLPSIGEAAGVGAAGNGT